MNEKDAEHNDLDPQVLTEVLPIFSRLTPNGRERLLQTIATFFDIGLKGKSNGSGPSSLAGQESSVTGGFSTERSMSAKEFMLQKQPKTDVERIASLAYFLTHYRGTPHFKTIDLSKLNTEAAQPKFSNAAFAVENAAKRGYLVVATKGNKQLSAAGEQFVQALPDRDEARVAMERARPRRPRMPSRKRNSNN